METNDVHPNIYEMEEWLDEVSEGIIAIAEAQAQFSAALAFIEATLIANGILQHPVTIAEGAAILRARGEYELAEVVEDGFNV